MKTEKGYTLLEILLVLILLAGAGFFLFIQLPQDVKTKGVELSAERLLADLREVQQASIAGNIYYRVKFYPETREYKIFRQGEIWRSVVLHDGVSFGNSPPELFILPTGAPVPGMTIILKAGERERRIIIAPVMGRIRLEIVR